jgi:uncharacterized protein YndB with AHSA1/START domain
MKRTFTARASVIIDAPARRVWDALTVPEIIKKYFFGTDTITDWKIGGPIQFCGEYNGQSYKDKGIVTAFEPYTLIQYKYWSSLSGIADVPENYLTISYFLAEADSKTRLDISQENVRDQMAKDHSEENWRKVLANLKKVVEDSSRVLAF